jgi:hypothetical protein
MEAGAWSHHASPYRGNLDAAFLPDITGTSIHLRQEPSTRDASRLSQFLKASIVLHRDNRQPWSGWMLYLDFSSDQKTALLSPTSYLDGRYHILLIATARVNLYSS